MHRVSCLEFPNTSSWLNQNVPICLIDFTVHGSSYKQQIFPCNRTGRQLLSHNAINIHTDDEYCVIFYRKHTAIFDKSYPLTCPEPDSLFICLELYKGG